MWNLFHSSLVNATLMLEIEIIIKCATRTVIKILYVFWSSPVVFILEYRLQGEDFLLETK